MRSKGIRIGDLNESGIISAKLSDILEEIPNGNLFHWSILFLDSMGNLGEGKSIPEFEKQIFDSEKGFFIDWNDLNILSKKFDEIVDITLMGCRDRNLLYRYSNDTEMYRACDIVIKMVDSSYWEVFSKDEELINRLASKCKEIEFLEPDFKR